MNFAAALAIGALVLAVALVNLRYAWRQLRRVEDLELGLSDEQVAEEHARPLGNVVPLRQPLEPDR